MKEENIVTSQKNKNFLVAMGVLAGICVLVGIILMATMTQEKRSYSGYYGYSYSSSTNYGQMGAGIALLVVAVIVILVAVISNKTKITVTDKRVVWETIFGAEKSLPIQYINSVSVGWFGSIRISTSSGRIKDIFLTDLNSLYFAVLELILLKDEENKETPKEN